MDKPATKYTVKFTNSFKKAYKLAIKRGKDISKLQTVVNLLANGEQLPQQYKDHALTGNWINHRECHIENDWLLIYRIVEDMLVLELVETGTHSDLFGR